MLDGITCALFTPIWGWTIDSGLFSPVPSLFIGSLCIIAGYLFLGYSSNVAMVGIGMTINGIGVASYYLITYLLMLSSSIESGLVPDTEQTQGMLTALWFSFESLGGYFGSACGGWAYDMIGFRNSTFVVIGTQTLSMLPLFVVWLVGQKQKRDSTRSKKYHPLPTGDTE